MKKIVFSFVLACLFGFNQNLPYSSAATLFGLFLFCFLFDIEKSPQLAWFSIVAAVLAYVSGATCWIYWGIYDESNTSSWMTFVLMGFLFVFHAAIYIACIWIAVNFIGHPRFLRLLRLEKYQRYVILFFFIAFIFNGG